MKRILGAAVLVTMLGALVAAAALAGGVNWKSEVRQDCKRLVVNARYVAKHPTQGRLAKLHRTAKACGLALRTIPGN